MNEDLMKAVCRTAKLGDVFSNTKAEANEWKKRMLVAGLGEAGISFPDNWDDLTEDDKEERLNKTIELGLS